MGLFDKFRKKDKLQEIKKDEGFNITQTEEIDEAVLEEQVKEEMIVEEAEIVSETIEETTETADEFHEEETLDKTEDTLKNTPSFFSKLKQGLTKTRNSLSEQINNVFATFVAVDEDLFEELEEALIMADIGVETSTYIIEELRNRVKHKFIKEAQGVKEELVLIISEIMAKQDSTMNVSTVPSVILVIGVNGVGKTTSIGKMAAHYKSEGKRVMLAAADTFRAAAIDQLDVWADRVGCEIIKHQENSDPAAVVFDACKAAKARGADILICDTAGRLHNKKNLMAELEKINRVISRELPESARETLLVLDATTGQNAVSQAKLFGEAAEISGIVLTKLDGTAKGGIVIALAKEQNLAVKFVGVGEKIDDLQEFVPMDFAKALFEE